MFREYGDRERLTFEALRTEGHRGRMPLYLTTFLVVVLERLIDHVLA